MTRLARLVTVVVLVGASMPAWSCPRSGVGIQLGSLFLGFSKNRPCPVYVQQVPVGGYAYAQPVVVAPPPPPPIYVAPVAARPPPPVMYAPPPMVVAPAPVVVAAPVVVRQPPPPRERSERPGFLAIKYMPGVSSTVALANDGKVDFGGPGFAHSPGLELRLTRWLSLRSDLEFRREGRTWDMLGVKLSLLPNSPVKPYGSVSFSGNESYANPGKYSFGFAGAAGLDVMFGKHFFIEGEVRYRMTPGSCCSDVPVVAGVVGAGVAFF